MLSIGLEFSPPPNIALKLSTESCIIDLFIPPLCEKCQPWGRRYYFIHSKKVAVFLKCTRKCKCIEDSLNNIQRGHRCGGSGSGGGGGGHQPYFGRPLSFVICKLFLGTFLASF